MTATTPPVKKACDACHRRKVKCSGGQPCNNCGATSLQCTYLSIPQKKGPKGSRAKVISEIRDTQQHHPPPPQLAQHPQGPLITPPAQARNEPSPFNFNSPLSPSLGRTPGLLSRETIDECLAFFFEHLYPTIPIFNHDKFPDLIYGHGSVQPEAYCLVASLCAFVMIQPGMTLNVSGALGVSYAGEPPQNRYGFANMLLEDVLRVRSGRDYVEQPALITVQTSFLLFCSYFTLEKQNSCWYYLREASTLAQLMKMHDESSYFAGDAAENLWKRRTFWLLLLTERAYAMERHRTLSLHPTIELPPMEESEQDVISGFVHLTKLFCCIDDDFMALWNKTKSDCSPEWISRLQARLRDVLPQHLHATEHQVADIRITQQWLKIMVWQLSVAHGHISSHPQDSALSFTYPIEVAKELVFDIENLSLASMEVHGVGLIEKLFDIACTLMDVMTCVPLGDPNVQSKPKEYLSAVLQLVAQLRGGASRYLPLLAARVKEFPNLAPPAQQMPLNIKQGYAGASDHVPTPMMPQSNGGSHFPDFMTDLRPIHRLAVNGQGLMFETCSPNTQTGTEASMSPHLARTPDGYPHPGYGTVPQPTSEPNTMYDSYPG